MILAPNVIIDLANNVRRGARLLDKKLGPQWRKTLQKHEEVFDFADGAHCVLGTLEHYNGAMKALRQKTVSKLAKNEHYLRAAVRLGVAESEDPYALKAQAVIHGFDARSNEYRYEELAVLGQLWRAEFGE